MKHKFYGRKKLQSAGDGREDRNAGEKQNKAK